MAVAKGIAFLDAIIQQNAVHMAALEAKEVVTPEVVK